jgi:hypothetical protein
LKNSHFFATFWRKFEKTRIKINVFLTIPNNTIKTNYSPAILKTGPRLNAGVCPNQHMIL